MDIKVDASNNIVKYPYFLTDLKVDNPKISFPRTALEDSDIRQQFNVLEVQDTSNPADDTQTSVEITPVWNGTQWVQSWETTAITAEELTLIQQCKSAEAQPEW